MTDAAFQARLRRFYALWRENNDIYAEWAQARGLSYFELLVILSLAEGEKTQRQICDQWTLPKQTVHSILRAFQRQGLFIVQDVLEMLAGVDSSQHRDEQRALHGIEFRHVILLPHGACGHLAIAIL